MPASRAFVAAALISLGLVAAVLAPDLAMAAVVADLFLALGVLLDHRRAARTPLLAFRSFPEVMALGNACGFEVRVANRSHRTLVLRAREALHPDLASGPIQTRLRVPAGGSETWRFTLSPRRRGTPALGPLTVRVLGPWGLAWAQRDALPPASCRVYPQTRFEGKAGRLLALAHRRELGRSPLRTQGVGGEPYGVRDYRPGDPLSRIHWKASARHQRLVAREDTWERGRSLVIVLDCARAMVSLDGGRSKLDHALAAALALTRVAVGRGDRVAVIAFSNRVERLVRVRQAARGVSEAYRALFDVSARLVEPAYDLVVETLPRVETRRSTVVLLTSVVDLASAELLRESLGRLVRRHRVLLVNLEDAELSALALGVPGQVAEAYAKTAALEVLLENRRLARRLRRSGIHSVTTAADRLAWSSLAAYLSLSDRARARSSRQRGTLTS